MLHGCSEWVLDLLPVLLKEHGLFLFFFFLLYTPVHDGRISSELALQLALVACAQRRFTSGVFEGTFIAKLVEIALIHLSRTFYCVDIASWRIDLFKRLAKDAVGEVSLFSTLSHSVPCFGNDSVA